MQKGRKKELDNLTTYVYNGLQRHYIRKLNYGIIKPLQVYEILEKASKKLRKIRLQYYKNMVET